MIIAGLQKLSLVDYPGLLASVVFVQGCNFRCGWCQNPDLVVRKDLPPIPEKEVISFLSYRKPIIEGLVITGGEPSIYEDLPVFIDKVKDLGLKVKLDTNGSNPPQLKSLLEGRKIDYVALDIKTSFPKYHLVADIEGISHIVQESARLIMSSDVPYEFRTTCVPGMVDASDIREIAEAVKGAKRYCLQQFRPFVTCDPAFAKVKPYSKETLGDFKKILSSYMQEVDMRGVY